MNIITFNWRASAWKERLTEVNPKNISDALMWLKRQQCGGSTNTYAALRIALADPNTQAIYLLTDGRPDQVGKKLFPLTIIIIYSLRVFFFYISVSWWFFTGVWVTASFLMSPGRFSVFWPFSLMQLVWMVSTCPVIFKSSSPFNNPLVTVPKAPITIGINVTFMCHSFSILYQGPGTYPSFQFLSFFGQPGQQSPQFCKFYFFVYCWLLYSLVFWPRLGDLFVCQSPIYIYVCHSPGKMLRCGNLLSFLLRCGTRPYERGTQWDSNSLERCCVVHITLVLMIKFKFLAHFPVDPLAYPVVSSLILLLC